MTGPSNFYELTFGASAAQTQLTEKLKANGCEVIQTARGLCLKAPMNAEDLGKLVQETADCENVKISALDPAKVQEPDYSRDVVAFVKN